MPHPTPETVATPERAAVLDDASPPSPVAARPSAPPASPPVAIELDLAPGHAGRVFRHKAVSGRRRGRTRTLDTTTTWHDAPDGLHRHGALLAQSDAGWAVQRTVRCCGWPVGTETLATVAPPGVHDVAPRPVAALQARTRRVELGAPDDVDAAPLALSLLEGTVRNVTAELAFCRLRVEGPPREAARLALALGETLPLVPARLSLAELARALGHDAEGEPATPEIAPAGDVDAAMAALFGALSAALLLWLARLGAFGEAEQRGEEIAIAPRAVHQARVATRRLRSALIVFAEPLGDSLAPLAGPLKALAATLGQARDWDVFLLETGAPVAAALDHDRRITALLAHAEAARRSAYAELRRVLGRPATRRLVLHLSLLAQLRPWSEVPEATPRRRHARSARPPGACNGARTDRPPLPQAGACGQASRPAPARGAARHPQDRQEAPLRARIPRPRPAPRDTRKLLRRLATLQDQLGALNDIAVGAALMGRIAPRAGPHGSGGHEFAAGAVAGWLAARAAASGAALGETWRAVRHTEKFWRV